MAIEHSLKHKVIAVPESRQLDVLCDLLINRGAKVIRCPLITIVDTEDVESVKSWLFQMVTGQHDALVVQTGEGLTRLHAFSKRFNIDRDFIDSLSLMTTIVRGVKPCRFLRAHQIKPDYIAEPATTEGLIEVVQSLDLKGMNVGLQLYSDHQNEPLQRAIRRQGGKVIPVAPYAYVNDADDDQVLVLLEKIEAGEVDAITFTSMIQVKHIMQVVDKHKLGEGYLTNVFKRCCVAVVGPKVGELLRDRGVAVSVMPSEKFYLKPLVTALVKEIGSL